MAFGVTLPIIKSESVSRCDGLYECGRCHAADTRTRKANCVFLFEVLASIYSEAYRYTFHSSLFFVAPGNVQEPLLQLLRFPVFILMTFAIKIIIIKYLTLHIISLLQDGEFFSFHFVS
jgi:hypothetical protein